MTVIHDPVLPAEVLSFIEGSAFHATGILVDCTLGEGGHTALLLDRFADLRIVAMERDRQILDIAKNRLDPYGERVSFINDNFSRIGSHMAGMPGGVQYVLYDFGISSFHFDASGRGFGFSRDERLDMRLDDEAPRDAWEIVNRAPEQELADIIFRFGEERHSRRIASRICYERQQGPVDTTAALAAIVLRAIPRRLQVRHIHPATRVFQAIRIAVNSELQAIEESLASVPDILASGGRILAISFHSLEDRIVKERFRRLARGCTCKEAPQRCLCDGAPRVRVLTKKPLTASEDEVARNPRSRSARLRVAEKL